MGREIRTMAVQN